MHTINELADKFAMKLGLESAPLELLENHERAPEVSRVMHTPTYSLRNYLYQIQSNFHALKTGLDLEDYNESTDSIARMIFLLNTLSSKIELQQLRLGKSKQK